MAAVNMPARSRVRLPSGWLHGARSAHLTLGLAAAALLYIVVLSGSLLMFANLLDHGQQAHVPAVGSVSSVQAQEAVDALPGGPEDWRRISLTYPAPQLPQLVLQAEDAHGVAHRFAVDASGTLHPQRPQWSGFLLELHKNLMLPGLPGGLLVGLLGISLLAMLISGVLSYPHVFRDAFLFRGRAHEWLRQADLHHRLGTWALPFHIAISFTGAAMALGVLVAALVGSFGYRVSVDAVGDALLGPSLGAEYVRAASPPDLVAILGKVGHGEAPAHIQRVIIMHPGQSNRLVRVDVAEPGRLVYGDRHFFDAQGHAITPGGMLQNHPGRAFYSGMVGLHFGGYGGLPLRIVYALLGLALCTIVASGMRQWLARQRTRACPRPRLENLWAGWVWGSALALAASYVAALASGYLAARPATVFACALALALLASLVASGHPRRLRWTLRGALAIIAIAGLVLAWV